MDLMYIWLGLFILAILFFLIAFLLKLDIKSDNLLVAGFITLGIVTIILIIIWMATESNYPIYFFSPEITIHGI